MSKFNVKDQVLDISRNEIGIVKDIDHSYYHPVIVQFPNSVRAFLEDGRYSVYDKIPSLELLSNDPKPKLNTNTMTYRDLDLFSEFRKYVDKELVSPKKNVCYCSTTLLMQKGCTCGAFFRESESLKEHNEKTSYLLKKRD